MTQLVVSIVVILLPGIVATIISDKLTSHSKWDSFKFGLYALVLGVFSYGILQFLVYIYNVLQSLTINGLNWQHLNIWNSALSGGQNISAWEVCSAFLLSVPVAFIASWIINHKVFNKIAQRIKISNKYGDENLFSYYLNSKEVNWVYVRDSDKDLIYQGRIVKFSENEKVHEIVLADVSVYADAEGEPELMYEIPTIYLCKECGKFSIEAIPRDDLGEKNER